MIAGYVLPEINGDNRKRSGGLSEQVIVHGSGHIKLDDHVDPYLATVLEPSSPLTPRRCGAPSPSSTAQRMQSIRGRRTQWRSGTITRGRARGFTSWKRVARRGVLPQLINAAPMYSVFSVVGSNPEPDELRTMSAINKNASLYFVTGPWYGENRYEALWRAYEHLLEGRFDPARMVTGYCGIEGADAAFRALRPESGAIEHVKIIVRHDSDSAEVISV